MGTKSVLKTKARPQLIHINSLGDVPDSASDEEAAEFWDTHSPDPRFFENVEVGDDPRLPAPRRKTAPLAVRFDANILARLKALAARRNKGYQTLLKEFVCERLYEEEKREGIIPPRDD